MLNVWQCLYNKTKCPNSILILFSRPPPDPQRLSVGNIFPPLSAKLFCHPHKWTHITTLSSALIRKDSSSTYSNNCCHALDLREWVARGETPLWLWRLHPLNISDNSEESLGVKSSFWRFSESGSQVYSGGGGGGETGGDSGCKYRDPWQVQAHLIQDLSLV